MGFDRASCESALRTHRGSVTAALDALLAPKSIMSNNNDNMEVEDENSELQHAIALSLEESCTPQVDPRVGTEEDMHRVAVESVRSVGQATVRNDGSLPPGILNTGNSCYASVILQILARSTLFMNRIMAVHIDESDYHAYLMSHHPEVRCLHETQLFLARMRLSQLTWLNPTPVLSAFRASLKVDRFANGAPEDVSEFLEDFLAVLETGLSLLSGRKEPSRGVLESLFRCTWQS